MAFVRSFLQTYDHICHGQSVKPTLGRTLCKMVGARGEAHITYCVVSLTIVMAMITEPPQNASQLEGRNVSFRCAAFGIPRPNITWMFAPANGMPMEPLNDGIIIDMDDRSIRVELNLTNITSGDFGAYYCVANNMFNNDTARALLEQGSE